MKGKKVFVGISGGVDSSVAALLLKKRGYDVTGVFINVWEPPFMECTMKNDRRDAMRVCARLKIPFLVCDAEEAYKSLVVDYMIEEYKRGRTPNPDVMCNKFVKFGVFYDFAMSRGADYVATGHYAISQDGKLFTARDKSKDQSYFLAQVKAEMLAKTIFPIGKYHKKWVRITAWLHGLFTAKKKDSQGLCFLGKLDMKEFLRNFVDIMAGDVLDTEGNVIGRHDGAVFVTIGERLGFVAHHKSPQDKSMYVVAKDVEKNTIIVSPYPEASTGIRTIKISNINVINTAKWQDSAVIDAIYRYHGKRHKAVLVQKDGAVQVLLDEPCSDIALGQILALYIGQECIGSGIIDSVLA